ncbi:MAG: hypothetical protein RL387_86 [Bacteroidota bacterium]|jgi:hypothetical protein
MRKIIINTVLGILILSSCSTPSKMADTYSGMYSEKPLSILIMPPINKTTNVDAKEYFHSTLNVPLANAGYYVVPSFLSMEILKRESAYDAELFLNAPLTKFQEVFQADIALFTIIHKWSKSYSVVKVEVEYILKSTKTNEILYSRRGEVDFNTSVSAGAGALLDIALTAVNTAATKYVDVARVTNMYTFKDLPTGRYNPNFGTDGQKPAGKKVFKVALNSGSH